MLENPTVCKVIALVLLAFGGYLAVYNTTLSAVIIGDRTGLGFIGGLAIACGITGCELWFAGWARNLANWQPLYRSFRESPERTFLKMAACGFGLALIYHFDILSTWVALQGMSRDFYFFLWGVAWLIFGPELTIALASWLILHSQKVESKFMKNNNSRDAERVKLRSERETMFAMAKEAGEQSAVRKISDRYGPSSS